MPNNTCEHCGSSQLIRGLTVSASGGGGDVRPSLLCKAKEKGRVAPVPAPFPDPDNDAPGPSHLGTGEAADLNRQEEARRLAGSAPTTAHVAKENPAPR